jgi:hypothetical protein
MFGALQFYSLNTGMYHNLTVNPPLSIPEAVISTPNFVWRQGNDLILIAETGTRCTFAAL